MIVRSSFCRFGKDYGSGSSEESDGVNVGNEYEVQSSKKQH
jgi:hypothetical protein